MSDIRVESRDKILISSFLVVVVPLLLFSTRATQQLRDSLLYLHGAKTATDMFHPHHIAFTPAIRWVSLLLGSLHDSYDIILAAQLHNIFWALVCTLCVFLILLRLCRSHWLALCGAGCLLLTRGFWELSTQSTVYVPAVDTVALLTITMQRPRTRMTSIWVSMVLALSVLYHQANVLICVPALVYWGAKWNSSGIKKAAAILLPAGTLVLGCYAVVFLRDNPWSTQAFIDFALAYTHEVSVGGQLSPSPSQWGTMQHLGFDGLYAMVKSLVWNIVVLPERVANIAIPSAGFLVGLVLLWHSTALVLRKSAAPLRAFLLSWVLMYGAFFLWWLPGYPHPFLLVFLPILILGFWMLDEFSRQFTLQPLLLYSTVVSVSLFIGTINFWKNVMPLQAEKTDAYMTAGQLHSRADENCQLMTTTAVWNHLRFYFDRQNVIQAKHPLAYFDLGEPLPERYHLPAAACIAIDARLTTPDYVIRNDGRIGYRNPTGWFQFLGWLFDFEYDVAHRLTRCRSFRSIRLADGSLYLRLLPQRMRVDGLQDFFQSLDHETAVHSKAHKPFQAWLNTHSPVDSILLSYSSGHIQIPR